MKLNIGNRVAEKDVRDALFDFGLDGRAAVIVDLELYALKRPGWVQVFSFRLRAKSLPNENYDFDRSEHSEDCRNET